MWNRFKWSPGLMDETSQFGLPTSPMGEHVKSHSLPMGQSPQCSKHDLLRFEMSTPSVEDAAEIQNFCLEVFPTSYDHNWYGYMLACDTVYKICYRHQGRIIALIVGQVARRDAWNGVLQPDSPCTKEQEKITAYIMLLGVEQSFRRCGLGSKLLVSFVRTVSAAWPTVPCSFFLHVAVENTAAMEMYRRHGFRKMQLLPHYYDYGKKGQAPEMHDAFLYVKDVSGESGEMLLDSLWDCLACTTTSAVTLVQRMISALMVPANYVFYYAKHFFSFPVQKFAPVRAQPTKVV